ncbi:hypothetical protein T484DRAFT_1745477 [Baffinella frigidus]|nr:hypothetical protein T484DRAFT_1745477 [Cryptophyta sp. CCMP2293]
MVRSSSKATAAFAVVAGIVAAVLVVTSRGAGRVSLMDADAPTSSEVAYAKKTLSALPVRHAAGKAKGRLQQAFQIPHAKIQAQNNKLQKQHPRCGTPLWGAARSLMRGAARQVVGLEHEVRELSADLTRKGHGHAVKRAQRQIHASVQPPATGQKLRMQWGQQAHLTKLVPETESGSAYYHVANLGDNAEALTTQAGDSNPIAALQPGDYWKDP